MTEQQVSGKKTSYVGAWLGSELYIEVGLFENRTEVKIRDKEMAELAFLGDFDQFLKKVKTLRKLSLKAGGKVDDGL